MNLVFDFLFFHHELCYNLIEVIDVLLKVEVKFVELFGMVLSNCLDFTKELILSG